MKFIKDDLLIFRLIEKMNRFCFRVNEIRELYAMILLITFWLCLWPPLLRFYSVDIIYFDLPEMNNSAVNSQLKKLAYASKSPADLIEEEEEEDEETFPL